MTDRETEIRRLKQLRQQKARELQTIEARLKSLGIEDDTIILSGIVTIEGTIAPLETR